MPQPMRFLRDASAPGELAAERAGAEQQDFEVVQQVEVEAVQLSPAHELDVQVDRLRRQPAHPRLLFLVHQFLQVERSLFDLREVRLLRELQRRDPRLHEEVVLRSLQERRALGQEVFEEQESRFFGACGFEELQVVEQQRVEFGLVAVSVEEAEARRVEFSGFELVGEQFVPDGEEASVVGVCADLSEVVVWVEVEAVGRGFCEPLDCLFGREEPGEPGLLGADEQEPAAEEVALEVREHDHREVVEPLLVQVAERESALRLQLFEFAGVFLAQRPCSAGTTVERREVRGFVGFFGVEEEERAPQVDLEGPALADGRGQEAPVIEVNFQARLRELGRDVIGEDVSRAVVESPVLDFFLLRWGVPSRVP